MGLYSTTDCSFCLNPESLLHVVAGCNSFLNRFTWRHDSVLNFLASILQLVHFNNLYVDLPRFHNPSIITGDEYRPDLLLKTKDDCPYILELTVRYETNLRNNIKRKQEKYRDVIIEQEKHFKTVKFINLSISALGVLAKESSAFIKMLNGLNISENISFRSSYYIFCGRNKEWTNPDLMKLNISYDLFVYRTVAFIVYLWFQIANCKLPAIVRFTVLCILLKRLIKFSLLS